MKIVLEFACIYMNIMTGKNFYLAGPKLRGFVKINFLCIIKLILVIIRKKDIEDVYQLDIMVVRF